MEKRFHFYTQKSSYTLATILKNVKGIGVGSKRGKYEHRLQQ